MALQYPDLFTPFNIGKCKIKNRISMSPMFTVGWTEKDGNLTEEIIEYYEERAKGGTGLIFTQVMWVDSDLETLVPSPFRYPAHFIQQTRRLADTLHMYGCKLFVQISFGFGRNIFPELLMGGVPVAPSIVKNRWDPNIICREITTEEVSRLISASAEAALLIKMAGADGIDFYCSGGYLTDQFSMQVCNQRTDEYGGNLQGRFKASCDVIKAIKHACGKDFPLTVRFGTKNYIKDLGKGGLPGEKFVEVGRDTQESLEGAKLLLEAGCDAFTFANGSYDAFYWLYPPMYQKDGLWLEEAALLKKAVGVPVICAGKINDPEMANKAIKTGMVDGVALGRAMLADPYWTKKASEGKPESIRPCIGCNSGCIGRVSQLGGLLTCAVNPNVCREMSNTLQPTPKKKNICVIGGGIAGMEAARLAAIRGHNVDLYEKTDKLGGVFVAASVPNFKDADRKLLKWYLREIKLSGVNVHLNIEMDLDKLKALTHDEIIVAVGAKPKIPRVPGIEQVHVATAVDVLLGQRPVGDQCVIVGGGQVGCKIALELRKQGKQVTLVEALGELMIGGAENVPQPNRFMLIDLILFNNIDVRLNSKIISIGKGDVTVQNVSGEESIRADTVIISVGYYADDSLYDKLKAELPNVWIVGDASTPSNILHAVAEGAAVGRSV